MGRRGVPTFRIVTAAIAVVLLVYCSFLAMPRMRRWWTGADQSQGFVRESGADKASVELVGDATLQLTPAVVESLGVQTALARNVTQGQTLELSGSLAPDTNRLVPVRSRFAGEVVEIGTTRDPETAGPTSFRTLDSGDKVVEGQLLAVVWSKELGEKKSELVDALSQMRLDEDTLKRLQAVYHDAGGIPEQQLRVAERSLAADRIAVRRADLTLRAWRLTDKEIKDLYQEAEQVAERILKGEKVRDSKKAEEWARVEVRAPFDGTLLEKNFTKGAIVDTSTNLFMLGDLTKLSAFAYAYEEDLPALKSLPAPIPWTIRLKADPRAKSLRGNIREIRPTLDPTMHAALVRGQVDNPEGRLVSGQFITADIQLPPPADEVEVPITALIEDGRDSIVFVQADPREYRFTMRRVAVVRRTRDTAYLRKAAPANDEDTGLQPGTRVVTAGALELQAALLERKAAKEARDGAHRGQK